MAERIPGKRPQHQRIEGTLELFVTKIYPPGSKMQSESHLMEIFRASRNTIRRSMDSLVERGLLTRKQGERVFINEQPTRETESAEPAPIRWPSQEDMQDLYQYTPGQRPPYEEGLPFVREMVRRKIVPEDHGEIEHKVSMVLSTVSADDFPHDDITNVATIVVKHLDSEGNFPISMVDDTVQKVIDDARTLQEQGVKGDVLTMSLRHPAAYYIEPLVIYRQKKAQATRRGKNKSRWEEKRDASEKHLTTMTAGEIIGLLRRATKTSLAALAKDIPGISPITLSRIETGQKSKIDIQQVALIATALENHGIRADDPRLLYLTTDASLGKDAPSIDKTLLDFVPLEIPFARIRIQAAMDSGTPAVTIAADIGKTIDEVNGFYSGATVDLSQGKGGRLIPESEENAPLKNFYKTVEEMRWLRTFKHLQDLPGNVRAGRGIKLLRIAKGKKQEEIYKRKQTVSANESGKKIPSAKRIREYLTAMSFDETSKAAQFLFLNSTEAENTQTRTKPMAIDELQKCDFATLIRYLRRLNGATSQEVSKHLGLKEHRFSDYESGSVMREEIFESFINWLYLDETKSTLAKVLRRKYQEQKTNKKRSLRKRFLKGVLEEQYLFQEHFDQLAPYELSETGETHKVELEAIQERGGSLGEMAGVLIGDETQYVTFSRESGVNNEVLGRIVSGKEPPNEKSLLNISAARGYGPHHPNFHLLFNYSEQIKAA